MRTLSVLFIVLAFSLSTLAQEWHKMSEAELKAAVPDKAPVIKENIETEFRTASGISNGKKKIFGVVMITAGYEADGKYTHFFSTGSAITVDNLDLPAGDYIFGYRRIDPDTLRVTFYKARSGELMGELKAAVERKKGGIYSFLITPPVANAGRIYVGRFSFDYRIK